MAYTYSTTHKHAVTALSSGNAYQYDSNGNMIQRTVSGQTYNFGYDAENRLTAVSGAAQASFGYNGDGQRVAATEGITKTVFVGNYFEWQVVDHGTYTSTQMSKYYYAGGVRVAMQRGGEGVKYLLGDHLGSASVEGRDPVYFEYNGLGYRISLEENSVTTHYTLDLATGLTQVLEDNSHKYVYGNGRIAQEDRFAIPGGATTDYFLGDALDSVRQLVDEDGVVTLAKGYEPFGETIWSVGRGESTFAYTGEAMDSTGLVYLRARYLDPYEWGPI